MIVILDKEALDSIHEEKNDTFKTSTTNAYEHSYLHHPSRYNGKHYFTKTRNLMGAIRNASFLNAIIDIP